MAGGELDRSAAYDYARDYLEPYLQENPDIQVTHKILPSGRQSPERTRLLLVTKKLQTGKPNHGTPSNPFFSKFDLTQRAH